ncbi:hypothetical protein QEO94_10260 [Kingella negevensis]|nr:hypothetical protein [Kingella negevensis]WII92994.1 hypothetical protein QEO94_10260 [Kingella negevensis]
MFQSQYLNDSRPEFDEAINTYIAQNPEYFANAEVDCLIAIAHQW